MATTFQELGLAPALCEAVLGLGYERPTVIQLAVIGPLLAGRDLVARSATGSGKTAAFGLPLLQGIDLGRRAPQVLVLCPTRELAGQVARELRGFGKRLPGLGVAELIGGQPKRRQREQLKRGVHVAVGTPGRLLDHLDHGFLEARGLAAVVLDEADRMLDMGFEDEVRAVLDHLPEGLQTALFSATLPDGVAALERAHLRDPLRVDGGGPEQPDPVGADLPTGIRQLHVPTERGDELRTLCAVLAAVEHESALVFCNFKASVAEVVGALADAGLDVDRLDGDLDQVERDEVLVRFRGGSLRVLVATDVAGRGLDIEGLDLVVNLELPASPETYVHRIGRTGRAGREGVAVSLSRPGGDRRLDEACALVGEDAESLDLGTPKPMGVLLRELDRPAAWGTIRIGGGRRDKLRAGDLLGALTGEVGGIDGADVGRIDVHERVTYVAVRRELAREAAARLDRGRIKKRRFRATLLGHPGARGGRRP